MQRYVEYDCGKGVRGDGGEMDVGRIKRDYLYILWCCCVAYITYGNWLLDIKTGKDYVYVATARNFLFSNFTLLQIPNKYIMQLVNELGTIPNSN